LDDRRTATVGTRVGCFLLPRLSKNQPRTDSTVETKHNHQHFQSKQQEQKEKET
jgi:hypothetical protein